MNLANKLSSHVLGMKFMRRTKNQVDKERVEKKHREHFAPPVVAEVEDNKADSKNLQKTVGHVEEIPSYSQCEKWIFGRQSFGGFNPEVELNVQKGVWRNHYVGEPAGTNEEEEPIKREVDNEVDVPDEEMAATYGSIIGTLAKHFKKKKDRHDHPKDRHDHPKDRQDHQRDRHDHPNKQNAKSGNRNEKQKFHQKQKFNKGSDAHAGNSRNQQQKNHGQKRSHESDNRREQHQQKQSNKKFFGGKQQQKNNEYGTPPKKKRFMKPSDD